MSEHEKAGADYAVDTLSSLTAKIERYKIALKYATYSIDGFGEARVKENLGRDGMDAILKGINTILGCDKCGDPDIYREWKGIKLCRICYEDLASEAENI